MGVILIIDDQEDLRFSLAQVVKKLGHTVMTAATGNEALEVLRTTIIDLVFLDIGLPDKNGIDLIPSIREVAGDVDIVMLTGINEARTAIDALKAGAVDYIVKPFELLEFKTILNRLIQSRMMEKRVFLEQKILGLKSIIGSSPVMERVKDAIKLAADVESPVLVTGETGTGKELVARAIHETGSGSGNIFVKVDCGTLSTSLIESELFGHSKGAFTDARTEKKGLVELANGGTLFLDEIGNLPLKLQPKLLRLIEESIFRKVGGLKDIQVKIRIIAATNIELEQKISNGHFREDLYYRLNVVPINLPPLRERGDDILQLASYFLHELKQDLKKQIKGFTPEASRKMLAHEWPGNIRELKNLIEREVIFCKTDWISMMNLEDISDKEQREDEHLLSLREIEKNYIKKVLNRVNNNKSKAARILGISRTTLREKL
ncbi:acetoacetate metabolism regulatory protein AtoC [Desulfomarina profundi]|uniref:Acetoacetate metabolism regulatory protein AtoC n=1 Tax=Desulfomarina profundi TaxID=2772557 RepID=A0A8D5FLH4_9BACT|nr:sigma-54 dependent transcriptional regulator [Desulfomarina profundi]BCL63145.1 acetoacetate metabolism regulatory protein AtoC [Desulfomarina profundi]